MALGQNKIGIMEHINSRIIAGMYLICLAAAATIT